MSDIYLAKNDVHDARKKHINVRYHFTIEILKEEKIILRRSTPRRIQQTCLRRPFICSISTLHRLDQYPYPSDERSIWVWTIIPYRVWTNYKNRPWARCVGNLQRAAELERIKEINSELENLHQGGQLLKMLRRLATWKKSIKHAILVL